ncbi:N-arachidonyl glycine receptor-like [Brienomyrus brachyistius]|uniref:N-arachidonyl glycine receptor-like n=1 Tax=Brienomyrus brachyistius TaxID=42636 RepID=UPI0020B2C67E|nr:N-arachidonyl glycine receptor-like [Brienomyrus brachyistius]
MHNDQNVSFKNIPWALTLEEHSIIGLVFYCFMLFFGIVINVTALWVFFLSTKKKTSITIYMINIAIVDLAFICLLPLRLVYYFQQRWAFGDLLCRICTAITVFYPAMALWLFALISADRFVVLTQCRHSNELKNVSKAVLSSVGVWIMVLGISLPLLFIKQDPDQASNFTTCSKMFDVAQLHVDGAVSFVRLVFYFLVPVCIIISCNTIILNNLTCGRAAKLKSKMKKQSVRIIVTLLLQIVICFVPYHICFIIQLVRPRTDELRTWSSSVGCLMNLSTILDILLFYIVSKQFKERVISVVRYRNYRRSRRRYNHAASVVI